MVRRLNSPTQIPQQQSAVERLVRSSTGDILPIDATDTDQIEGLADIALSGSAADLDTGTIPAGRMPAHTGDVTSSVGAVALTIPNDTVTYAKMQNVSAASKLLGRGDSGSGDTQEITLGSGLSMTGTTLAATYTDPWTYVKLTSTFSTSSLSAVSTGLSVAGSAFAANSYYEFEVHAYTQKSGGGVNNYTTQLLWPTGITGGAALLIANGTASSLLGGGSAAVTGTAAGVYWLRGTFYTTAAPTGNLQLQQLVGDAAVTAFVSRGAYLKYRAYT